MPSLPHLDSLARRLLRLAAPAALLCVSVLCVSVLCVSVLSSCSKSGCDGVEIDGQCEPVCVDTACPDGSRCVQNLCSPRCSDDADCEDGICRSVTADYGGRGDYCLYATRPDVVPNDASTSPPDVTDPDGLLGATCTENADCARSDRQVNCVAGRCVVACLLHEHCGQAGSCTGEALDSDGDVVSFCQGDDFPRRPGQYGTRCLNGNSDCDDAAGFRCLSRGEGDIDGYCSALGCSDDTSCPAGYYCNTDVFAGLAPCSPACGLPAAPNDPECVAADEIGDGKPFRCGDNGLELRSCRRRSFCNRCDSDADCRSEAHQVCARDASGEKICTVLCDPFANSCPWGTATACDVFDSALGVPTCSHRAGSCRDSSGASCSPCIDDMDCPGGFCSGSSFTGERFCLDLGAACECPAGQDVCFGGGCPTTPGGLVMNCVPIAQGQPPSVCFGASVVPDDPAGQLGCWPTP